MNKFFSIVACLCLGFSSFSFADNVIWSGKINSNGTPTESVKLSLGKMYKVKVSGTMNLGKWRTDKQPLVNDSCYEFFADPGHQKGNPIKIDTFKNSLNVSVCDGKYHADNVYESEPFFAAQSGIHFWIYDTDYENNTGALDVQIIQVSDDSPAEPQPDAKASS